MSTQWNADLHPRSDSGKFDFADNSRDEADMTLAWNEEGSQSAIKEALAAYEMDLPLCRESETEPWVVDWDRLDDTYDGEVPLRDDDLERISHLANDLDDLEGIGDPIEHDVKLEYGFYGSEYEKTQRMMLQNNRLVSSLEADRSEFQDALFEHDGPEFEMTQQQPNIVNMALDTKLGSFYVLKGGEMKHATLTAGDFTEPIEGRGVYRNKTGEYVVLEPWRAATIPSDVLDAARHPANPNVYYASGLDDHVALTPSNKKQWDTFITDEVGVTANYANRVIIAADYEPANRIDATYNLVNRADAFPNYDTKKPSDWDDAGIETSSDDGLWEARSCKGNNGQFVRTVRLDPSLNAQLPESLRVESGFYSGQDSEIPTMVFGTTSESRESVKMFYMEAILESNERIIL